MPILRSANARVIIEGVGAIVVSLAIAILAIAATGSVLRLILNAL